jgi:hypothetical protein
MGVVSPGGSRHIAAAYTGSCLPRTAPLWSAAPELRFEFGAGLSFFKTGTALVCSSNCDHRCAPPSTQCLSHVSHCIIFCLQSGQRVQFPATNSNPGRALRPMDWPLTPRCAIQRSGTLDGKVANRLLCRVACFTRRAVTAVATCMTSRQGPNFLVSGACKKSCTQAKG